MGKIFYESPVGPLLVEAENGFVTRLDFCGLEADQPVESEETGEEDLLKQAAKELDEYFAGRRKKFDLPLKPKGTEFQQKVWQALLDIPYGQLRSYKNIAEAVGCPKGFRAVGLANNKNPIAIVIPCHRVVGSNGNMVGYAGGVSRKQRLLALEQGEQLRLYP